MQQQIDMRQLQKILDSHAAEITTLQCMVAGLYRHISATQGAEGVASAIDLALKEASGVHGFNVARPDTGRIRKFGEALKQQK